MTRPWNVVGVFCEDIREEKNGSTLLGTFPDNLSMSSLPAALPKLGIYIRCHIKNDAKVGPISAALLFPDGNKVQLGDFDEAAVEATIKDARDKGAPLAGFILTGVAVMVPILMVGRILAMVRIGDEEVLAAALNVEMAPSSNASPPPPSQSEPDAPAS